MLELLPSMLQLGLYKVEFRILEIRISGETNLKKHFLSGNWIRRKIFKGLPNRRVVRITQF